MLPHSSFGIRVRKGKSKGYWWEARTKRSKKPVQIAQPDEGKVEGVSDTLKKLLRG